MPTSETLGTTQHYRIEGFKRDPLVDRIMPRHASLSDSGCYFFCSRGSGRTLNRRSTLTFIFVHAFSEFN